MGEHQEHIARKTGAVSKFGWLFGTRSAAGQIDGAMPLSAMRRPGSAKIVRVCCAEGAEVQRLCEMGLVAGCRLRLTQRRGDDDPVLVQIGDCRMCLDQHVAQHFWVES